MNFKLLEMTMHSCVIVRDFHVHVLREPGDARDALKYKLTLIVDSFDVAKLPPR